jgi:rare lipoprotein A
MLLTALLALAVGAGASGTASAGASDHIRGYLSRDDGMRSADTGRRAAPPRQRLARATYSDSDDTYEEPRRRRYDTDARKPRAKTRHVRSGKHLKRHRTARRHAKGRRMAHHGKRTTRRAGTPAWAKRSLSTDGPIATLLGLASFYWQPQRVAAGGWFNPNAMTAAHKTLPFGTRVRVTHMGNGRSVNVKINDRGPYIAGRIIDLSKAAAGVIGMQQQGVARVKVTVLGR